MYNPHYLTLSRHHIYYFRFPIPPELHPLGKPSDIRLSLSTRTPQEALYLARYLLSFGQNLLLQRAALKKMNYHEIRQFLTEYFKDKRDMLKEQIAQEGQFPPDRVALMKHKIEDAEQDLEDGFFELVGTDETLQSVIEKNSLPIKRDDKSYDVFRLEYVKAVRDHFQSMLEYSAQYDKFEFSTAQYAQPLQPPKPSGKKLAEAIVTYIEERVRFGRWMDQTAREARSHFDLLLEYVGNDASLDLSSDVANDVQKMLMSIPQRARSLDKYKKLSLHDLMELKDTKKLSPQHVMNYLRSYSSFYDWAVKRKHAQENNFASLLEKVSAEQLRDAFTPEQVQIILDEITLNKNGLIKKGYQKWGALIGLYTGARVNEIGQLALDDIKQDESGIWYFDINDDGGRKRLKNKASKRKIPIHSKLIDAGILGYVKTLRGKGKKRLFHDLSYNKKNGYGRSLSRWFNGRFLVDLGIKSEALVFHSLRHTVVSRLLQGGVEDSIVKSIVGHSIAGVTHNVYAKEGYTLQQLKDALEKLPY